jgi:alanyl-tRNA synthetase
MDSREIRNSFLEFQKARGHAIIPSASLIPENDPTLLFTNSGMFPLVPYLLGEEHPAGKRLADSQKSFRAEDIDEVGDNRHDTFFEMLGNWSLGDYFKKDQLNWWFEFLVREMRIDPRRLYETVYAGDERAPRDGESVEILKGIFADYGVEAEEGPPTFGKGALGPGEELDFTRQRIFAYCDKNWWQRGDAIGELGGPDSETFYDTGKPHDSSFGKYCHLNCDCGRFLEIGNSVFMQYQRAENGWKELKSKNVDFGSGLERLAMAVNNLNDIFESDLFSPIIKKIEKLSGKRYSEDQKAFEIIADHLKAACFIMADDKGISPSNRGQGYIVRRLIRRAICYGKKIGINKVAWTGEIAEAVPPIYQGIYPEIERNFEFVSSEFSREEKKFAEALDKGLEELCRGIKNHPWESDFTEPVIQSGDIGPSYWFDAFYFYQTFGLPIEMIKEEFIGKAPSITNLPKSVIEEKWSGIEEDFYKKQAEHQQLSRTASAGMFKGGLADASEKTTKLHTVTHLLLASLRQILGPEVFQKGSNITAERLRFDFSFPRKLTEKESQDVENLVNEKISENLPVTVEEISLEKAKEMGAMGIFDERYGAKVKIYFIGRPGEKPFSLEICGGPHIKMTGELGKFRIIKEEASSRGVRRIKANVD